MAETYFYREAKEKDYTVISNAFIQDDALSMKAKGLFCYLLSLPENWTIYMSEIVKHFKDGRDAISSAVKELNNAGYIRRDTVRNKDGKINGCAYHIIENPKLEKPNTDNPFTENPHTGKPFTENPTLQSTNNTKDLDIQNTDNTKSLVENAGDVSDESDCENKNDECDCGENANILNYNADELFDKAYKLYPRKDGKAEGKQHYLKYLTDGRKIKGQPKLKYNHGQLSVAIQIFAEEMKGRDIDKIQMFSTFMNTTVIDYIEKTETEYKAAMLKKYGDGWEKLKFKYFYDGQKNTDKSDKGGVKP